MKSAPPPDADSDEATPSVLYKFRSHTPHAIDALRRGVVWMAGSNSFNDPFDCKAELLGLAASAANAEKLARQTRVASLMVFLRRAVLADKGFAGESAALTARRLEQLGQVADIDEAYAQYLEWYRSLPISFPLLDVRDIPKRVETFLSGVGVLSLSASSDHMLLWAHYANSHRGFALGFGREPGTPLGDETLCARVEYSSTFSTVDLDRAQFTHTMSPNLGGGQASLDVKTDDPVIHAVIFTKSDVWSYEREWRFVEGGADRERAFPGPLREIVFGLRCPADVRVEIREATEGSEGPIRWREIRSEDNSFQLSVHDL